uniref:ATP synthase F0 subunit 8 n=1 Tax=Pheidole flaveria TaxID=614974 RepID=UPI002579F32B|nr:ATP synthase F0 subunit 8 [Pheidole flaveria]WGV34147.1 ATP synthase F0 subunit 8 [Pheidole flaveria]
MPQMMPMLWMTMLMFTLMILFMITSFIYFLYAPFFPPTNHKPLHTFTNWNWSW